MKGKYYGQTTLGKIITLDELINLDISDSKKKEMIVKGLMMYGGNLGGWIGTEDNLGLSWNERYYIKELVQTNEATNPSYGCHVYDLLFEKYSDLFNLEYLKYIGPLKTSANNFEDLIKSRMYNGIQAGSENSLVPEFTFYYDSELCNLGIVFSSDSLFEVHMGWFKEFDYSIIDNEIVFHGIIYSTEKTIINPPKQSRR
ncbi:MAG: hypothetical protein GON13_00535 [Nanoarchaeota archaeon]|nr:hypothetical protein [Nanoarchaeota archaeon]